MKNKIEVFKVPYISNFEGRANDINPYIIVNWNNMMVLIEVPKEYAKINFDIHDYYFLASDLIDAEKDFFGDFHTVLECDYLYKIDHNNKKREHHKIFKKIWGLKK